METEKKAIVLLSGGLDSATVLAIAAREGNRIFALTFNYGQRHAHEVLCAGKIASFYGVRDHFIFDLDLASMGGSALTGSLAVPKGRTQEQISSSIPPTYVPARNTIFLSLALGFAEVHDCNDIYIGVNAIDYSGYPDCRPEFVESFQAMANLACSTWSEGDKTLTLHAPLIAMRKCEIIRKGTLLGVDYSLTTSCYDPPENGVSCGECDACLLRKMGFADAGIKDPTRYEKSGSQ